MKILMTLLALGMGLQTLWAADPVERPEVSITRTAQDGLTFNTHLSRNVYRYVQRVETYIEQVPYTVTVPYQVWVTYYRNEYQCYWQQVPVQSCHNQQVCNPQGQCHNQQVCQTTWQNRQVCRWVMVPYQQLETRYRNEIRYRPEQRTRIVTDKFFDHQWAADVRVIFPEGTLLQGDETETLLIKLAGSETNPDAEASVNSPVFNYRTGTHEIQSRLVILRLESFFRYQPSDLDAKTISGLTLVSSETGKDAQVRFEDKGIVSRVGSQYQVQIIDTYSGTLVAELKGSTSFGTKTVILPVPVTVLRELDLKIKLSVERQGEVIAGGIVKFETEATRKGQMNPADYGSISVRNLRIEGQKQAAKIIFADVSPDHQRVKTTYEIGIRRGGHEKPLLARAIFDRKSIQLREDGMLSIPVTEFPGLKPSDIAKHFENGDNLILEIGIERQSALFPATVRFFKMAEVKIGG